MLCILRSRFHPALAALVLAACGTTSTVEDAGERDASSDAAAVCSNDEDCRDALACNGPERCAPDDPEADALGCVAGDPPCEQDESCAEPDGTCSPIDCDNPDRDADGHDAVACGGDDCDDNDDNRYPGNAEVCDSAGHDEDCNDTTLGPDDDADGYAPLDCCNGATCGQDCDDTSSTVFPTASDGCGGGDEDCDGTTDEDEPAGVFYRDVDQDGFGTESNSVVACSQPDGYVPTPGDCVDDTTPQSRLINPSAAEICDEVDNDCDGDVDADDSDVASCACLDGHTRMCGRARGDGFEVRGVCMTAMQTCVDGAWPGGDHDPSACPGANFGVSEETACNGVDDDCDGTVDENITRPCTSACGTGTETCSDGTFSGCDAPLPSVRCYLDNDADGYSVLGTAPTLRCDSCESNETALSPSGGNSDCNDFDRDIHPGAAERTGDEVDQNCDGRERCYQDADGDGYRRREATVMVDGRRCRPEDGAAPTSAETEDGAFRFFRPWCDQNAEIRPNASHRTRAISGAPSSRNYDWNCDGTESRELTRVESCYYHVGSASCRGSEGWDRNAPVPSCGMPGRWQTCRTSGSGICETYRDRVQPCR